MPPSGSSFFSFATTACKLALALSTIGYAAATVRRMRVENAQLHATVERTRAECEKLRAQVEEERARAVDAVAEKEEAREFWGRVDALARAELARNAETAAERDALLEAQMAQVTGLQADLCDARAQASTAHQLDLLPCVAVADLPSLPVGAGPLSEAASSPSPRSPRLTSDDTVLQMVRTLNLEISEVASRVTNEYKVAETPDPTRISAAYERAREAVGPVMAELLESIQHQDDPILIDIALKADMVGFAAEVVSAWDFQHHSRSVFGGVYRQMRRSESQLACGHWRAYARKYSKQRLYNGRDLAADFAHQLAERVADLLTLARGASADADAVYAAHGSRMDTIARTALTLQRVVGEEIVTVDYEVLVVRIDDEFDAAQMEDIYQGEISATGPPGVTPRVLSTADLGLRRSEKVSSSSAAGEWGERDDGVVMTMLLKPKVVLDTIVYELGLEEEEDANSASFAPVL